ncbi:MAG: hypothetical protein B6U72_04705 [Candidatus Altiarchaeales archaeon ex4484_2]|nr:MAG: hypothetical protein B6U72_04705 [Candidatus Altiarchaeales archaeon ex4484_2]
MEKNKKKTFLEKHSLDDRDLKTPKHDAIVLALMDKRLMLEVIRKVVPALNWGGLSGVPIEYVFSRVVCEMPIMKGEGKSEVIIGYVDFYVEFYSNFLGGKRFFIEVKSRVASFGDVLRQMRTYMQYIDAIPILVAPMTGEMKEKFESQGVRVYIWEGVEKEESKLQLAIKREEKEGRERKEKEGMEREERERKQIEDEMIRAEKSEKEGKEPEKNMRGLFLLDFLVFILAVVYNIILFFFRGGINMDLLGLMGIGLLILGAPSFILLTLTLILKVLGR